MTTSKFFGGVRGFAIAGNSMRTRIFLFLFFASTSGLWAQQARQVREVREERGEEAQVQEVRELPQGREGNTNTTHINNYGLPEMGASVTPASEIVNRRIRVGEKKDGDSVRGSVTVNFVNVKDAYDKGNSGNGTGGNGNQGGMQEAIGIEWVPPREPNVFVRGDVNGDGQISVVDSMAILYWLNVTGPGAVGPAAHPPAWTSGFPCHDAADADDDGWLSKFDALKILVYVFMGNVTLPAPSASSYNYIASDCGEDLTGDSLGCDMESAICQ